MNIELKPMNSLQVVDLLNSVAKGNDPYVAHGTVTHKIRTVLTTGEYEIKQEPTGVKNVERSVYYMGTPAVTKLLLSFRRTEGLVQAAVKPAEPMGVVIRDVPEQAQPEPAPSTALTIITGADGVQTMSSLEMVAFINATREPGAPELLHKNFMAKVLEVLKNAAAKFSATAFYTVNGAQRSRPIYNFPRREAMLMAMSYSYDLQARVFDAWEAAEAKAAKPVATLPNFDDPIEAAEAWIAQRKQSNALKLELSTATAQIEADKPKVEFYETVAGEDKGSAVSDVAKELGIGEVHLFELLRSTGYLQKFPWNRPYQRHIDAGLFTVKRGSYKKNGETVASYTTLITGKGEIKIAALVKEYNADRAAFRRNLAAKQAA